MKYNEEYYKNKILELYGVDDKKTLYNAKKWIEKLNMIVYIPGNEQQPWTEDMLGHTVAKMPTKAQCGRSQVGDYQMYLPDYDKYVGILGERKSVSDAYQTFLTGLDRFHREIDRFEIDERFDTFVVIIEGTREEYMQHQPPFRGKKFNKKIWMKQAKGAQHNKANKRGVMNSLMARGVVIHFAGDREQAAKDFVDICKKWLRYNYTNILKIE